MIKDAWRQVMISLEVLGYENEKWLKVREWNGIDRPSYYKILKLREDEQTLSGGRFVNYAFLKDWRYKIEQGYSDVAIIEEIVTWISDNVSGRWSIDVGHGWQYEYLWHFMFERDEDAMAFKLRWYYE